MAKSRKLKLLPHLEYSFAVHHDRHLDQASSFKRENEPAPPPSHRFGLARLIRGKARLSDSLRVDLGADTL